VERCLEALAQIDRNANQSILVDAWLDDLGQAAMGRPVAAVGGS
jgi:hypothetical protein